MNPASGATCPASEVLEGIAVGRNATPHVLAHVQACGTCSAAITRMRADNRFLQSFAIGGGLPRAVTSDTTHDIEVPGYDIVREIHRGGQGVVYQAVQRSTKRDVAIKVMRQGPFATLADRVRFEREIETLGRIEHPNIVAVHDAGVTAGFHYFVMRYIDGKPLDEAISDPAFWSSDANRAAAAPTHESANPTLSAARIAGADRSRSHNSKSRIAGVLDVFIKVCDAVHAAHLRGVIHRDLKPSNIRVDRGGEPYVLDFGLAKSADAEHDSAMTRTGQFVGSLPWASPEQVEGLAEKIDLRTDVYSLGAMLYQLLTGELPFDVGSNLRDALDNILGREPRRPSSVVAHASAVRERRETDRGAAVHPIQTIDDELDTIVLKCLSKDRERRYQSAGELARDLRRYLAGEPIEAKRDSSLYVLSKVLRRYRLRVAAAGALVVLLAIFAILMAVLYRRSARLEQEATQAAVSLGESLSQSNIEQGRMAGMLGSLERAEQLLWGELLTRREQGAGSVVRLNDPPGPTEPYWALWELYRRQPCLRTLALPPVGGRFITVADDGANIWTLESDGRVRKLDAHGRELDAYTLGRRTEVSLITISADGSCALTSNGARFALWRRNSAAQPLMEFPFQAYADMSGVFLMRDGKQIAVVIPGAVVVWRIEPFEEVGRFTTPEFEPVAVALSNDGARLAVRDLQGGLHVWDIASRRRIAHAASDNLKHENLHATGPLRFSPDDQRIADGWWTIPGRIWDLTTDPPTSVELNERPASYRVSEFSPDGRALAIGDMSGAVRMFDAQTGRCVSTFVAHPGRVRAVSFARDGRTIWTCGDAAARHWEVAPDAGTHVVRIANEGLHCVDVAPDGSSYVAGGIFGKLTRVDAGTRAVETQTFGNEATVSSVAISPDGRWMAAATYANAVFRWDRRRPDEPPTRLPHPAKVSFVAFSPDGDRIATACDDFAVRIWRSTDGTLEHAFTELGDRIPQTAFDPSGRRLAAALRNGALLVWDTQARTCETWVEPSRIPLRAVRFSPDGRRLYTGGATRTLDVWDVETRTRIASLVGHNQEIYCLDVNPDGDLIASGDSGGLIRLWSTALGRPLATLDGHTGSVMALRFSPDGRTLASAALDGTLRLWDLTSYARHMAGNIEAQLERIDADDRDPERATAWRRWAAEVTDELP